MSVTHSLSHFDLTKALPESGAGVLLLLGVLGGCPSNSLLASHHLKACLTSLTKIKVPKLRADLAGCKCRVGNRSVVFWLSCWSPVYLSWQEWLTRPVSDAAKNKSPTSFFLGWAPFLNCVWESWQRFGPKHITVRRALLHQTSFFNFMEAFIFKWQSWSELLQSLLQCPCHQKGCWVPARGWEPCCKGRAQHSAGCSQLTGQLSIRLFSKAACCGVCVPPTWRYKGTIFVSCSLAMGACCTAKAVPTTGAAAGEESGVRAVTSHRNPSPHRIPHAPAV